MRNLNSFQFKLERGSLSGGSGKELDYPHVARTGFIPISDFYRLEISEGLDSAVFIYDPNYNRITSSTWLDKRYYTCEEIDAADGRIINVSADISNQMYLRFIFRLPNSSDPSNPIDISFVANNTKYISVKEYRLNELSNCSINYFYLENGSIRRIDGRQYDAETVYRTKLIPADYFGSIRVMYTSQLYCLAVFAYNENKVRINSTNWYQNTGLFDIYLISELLEIDIDEIKYLRFIFRNDASTEFDVDDLKTNIKYLSCLNINRLRQGSTLSGKRISIYGDSISTFKGYIPEGNATYYTGGNAGLYSVYQTWWKKTIDALGMELLINNSWSGRAVSSCRDQSTGHTTDAGYKEANVLQLKNGDILPEVIIVTLGINDFNDDVELGTYDGSTPLPTNPEKFLDAYAMMLNLIMTNFPLADVYVCTLMQCERNGAAGFPETNAKGDSIGQWNDGIRKLAHAFGCKIINHDMCGITYYNLSTYMGDYQSSTGAGLHPNADGHSLIANSTIHDMDNAIRIRF